MRTTRAKVNSGVSSPAIKTAESEDRKKQSARQVQRNLTDAFLRTLRPPGSGRLEMRDTALTGLVLRMTSNGVATWSIRARTRDGKQTRPTLGTWPAMGIAEARKQAMVKLAEVHKGADPVADKRAARAARAALAAEVTVAYRLEEWRNSREADRAAAWSPRYAAEVKRVCAKTVAPALGSRTLRSTTREDWTTLLRKHQKVGAGAAAFLYRTVSSFLNYSEAQGWIPHPLLPRKGASTIAPPPPSRERVLTDNELLLIWQAADREPPKLRTFTRFLILTGAREIEVADISIGELDLEAGRWAIPGPRTKNRKSITVPLCPMAVAELRNIWPPEHVAAHGGWRLLGKIAGPGFRGFGKLKERIDTASGVHGWRWHDLRRTARTGMARLGVDRLHASLAINHISDVSKLERTYDRHDYGAEIISALSVWQAHVAAVVASQRNLNVIQLRGHS